MEGLQRITAKRLALVGVFLLIALLGAYLFTPSLFGVDAGDPEAYNGTTATIVDDETGDPLGTVAVVVADAYSERYTGLSQNRITARGSGMLFVHDDVDERTYVMRDMSFGLDIIFLDADGTITSIHDAPEPPPGTDGSEQKYKGTGQVRPRGQP
ncbi:MAG: DUF192 domain-containing protein [Natrialbaceae archaeon]|nr:DUF192 domain-containing protein [Natrialbaceae archaeon]